MMHEFARDHGPGFSDDPEQNDRMADLTIAADRLREAIETVTRSMLRGSAIEKAEARDQFDMALARFAALLDETRE